MRIFKVLFAFALTFGFYVGICRGQEGKALFESDVFQTDAGELKITFIGHGTLMFTFADKVIHVDPVSREADYAKLPKADIVLVTHGHRDHLDPKAIAAIRRKSTVVILPEKFATKVPDSDIMRNGDSKTIEGMKFEATPAYNLIHKRPSGQLFHPRGEGNGYVITFGDKRVYVAGHTENIPEMKKLPDIDIAFLPMNLPYTMTPEMATDAAKGFRPKILYPYHFGDTDLSAFVKLMQGEKKIEIRLRKMK